MSDFFNRLDLLRQKKGETLVYVGEIAGVSGPAVHSWRKGGLPKPNKLRLLAEHYGVSVEFLLTGERRTSSEIREDSPTPDDGKSLYMSYHGLMGHNPCPHCLTMAARITELERKLDLSNETTNNLSKALAEGRAGVSPAADANCNGNSKSRSF